MKKYLVKYRLQIRHLHAYGDDKYVVENTIVKANTFAEARAKVKNNDSDIKILSVEEVK